VNLAVDRHKPVDADRRREETAGRRKNTACRDRIFGLADPTPSVAILLRRRRNNAFTDTSHSRVPFFSKRRSRRQLEKF